MWQYEGCFLTKFPDRCGVIKWTNFRYRAECDTKKRALSRKGERAEEACLMLLPDLFFALGGGHWGLCDEEGIGVHGEDANSDGESDLLRRRVGSCHNF